jgi:ParB family chromosome partitioning protein
LIRARDLTVRLRTAAVNAVRGLTKSCGHRMPASSNLQRRDVHPLEEAQGFRALLNLDEPKYSVEQIAAKTGKSPAYVTTRVKLTELAAPVIDAFYVEEIGVGHALLLAKLQPDQQEAALAACFREDWQGGSGKQKRILLPVRNLQFWIDSNILLILKDAPFDKKDGQLAPAAGNCVDCPKRTGTTSSCFPTSASRTPAPTPPATSRKWMLMWPRPSRPNRG